MAEVGLPTFVRHYKYRTRMEEGPFVVKYVLTGDVKINAEVESKGEEGVQEIVSEIKPEKSTGNEGVSIKPVEPAAKKVERKEEKRIVMSRSELEELTKYTKVNMKEIRII